MIVYGTGLSPFVRKLAIYMDEKALAFELVPAGLGRGGPAFEEASPFGKIPALRDPQADEGCDFCLADSSAIIAYLEAKHPEPGLIPTAPVARGKATWFDEFGDTIVFDIGRRIFFNRFVAPKVLKRPGDLAAAEAAVEELPRVFDYLERVVPDSGFLVEDRLTIADIAVASPFVNLAHVDVTIDAARWPKTVAYLEGIHARPSFATRVEQERALVARMG